MKFERKIVDCNIFGAEFDIRRERRKCRQHGEKWEKTAPDTTDYHSVDVFSQRLFSAKNE